LSEKYSEGRWPSSSSSTSTSVYSAPTSASAACGAIAAVPGV